MGKIIKRIIILFNLILIISACGVKKWKYDLPNNYQIKKVSSSQMKVGYLKSNVLYTELYGKQVGINKYVAEFQISDNFIGLKCIEKNTLEVIYYLIDTKNQDVYGSYSDLETYLQVASKITNGEKFDEFKSTLDFDN